MSRPTVNLETMKCLNDSSIFGCHAGNNHQTTDAEPKTMVISVALTEVKHWFSFWRLQEHLVYQERTNEHHVRVVIMITPGGNWSRIYSQQWLLWLGEHLGLHGPVWRRSRALARSVLTTLQNCDTNTAQHKRQGEGLTVSESYEMLK